MGLNPKMDDGLSRDEDEEERPEEAARWPLIAQTFFCRCSNEHLTDTKQVSNAIGIQGIRLWHLICSLSQQQGD